MKKLKLIMSNLLSILLLMTMVVKGPELHSKYLIKTVGSQVVRVLNTAGNGGGTGFHVKLDIGYAILTNKHVCKGVTKRVRRDVRTGRSELYFVDKLIIEKNGKKFTKNIIAISESHDLCLIEPIFDDGLSIGSDPDVGDIGAILGHPRLTPLRYERAQFVSSGEAEICIKSNIFFCMKSIVYDVNMYSSFIQPGNSGSPVVNFWGNLVGVVFAGGAGDNTLVVPLPYVKDFLRDK